MQSARRHLGYAALLSVAALLLGCGDSKPKTAPPPPPRYATLPAKTVPEFLKDTIFERTDLIDTEPRLISGYGIVAHLNNTADNTLVPQTVRDYIVKEMVKHGFGSKLQPGFENMQPEQMLRSPSVAVVRIDGYLPPGVRKGDRFDVQVSALPGTNTTSVARGVLYRTELKPNGAFVQRPGYEVNVAAYAEGSVFVNPAYALEGPAPKTDQAKTSLRFGMVMDGGMSMDYRPLILRLRQPQRSLAWAMGRLIEQRFSSLKDNQIDPFADRIAAAKDEGIIYVQVPADYHGDWKHFAGVMTHMYLETRPGLMAEKARKLAEEAVKPDAALQDISYCWEAIGTPSLEFIQPLLTSDKPEVAFAAARAAAYIGGEPAAISTLVRIATTRNNPFQINAIQVLGDVPGSAVVSSEIRKLLDCDQNLVRVEAYKVLAAKEDKIIFSTPIGNKFVLDIVPSSGTPIIYASRRGTPRIAIIGAKPAINLPAMFTALDDQFSISSPAQAQTVTIFYRGMDVRKPVRVQSNPDIAEIAARLGGIGAPGEPTLNFSYGDVVAMLQSLSDGQKVCALLNGQRVPATFVMQEAPQVQQDIYDAPIIPEQGRPESDSATNEESPRLSRGLE